MVPSRVPDANDMAAEVYSPSRLPAHAGGFLGKRTSNTEPSFGFGFGLGGKRHVTSISDGPDPASFLKRRRLHELNGEALPVDHEHAERDASRVKRSRLHGSAAAEDDRPGENAQLDVPVFSQRQVHLLEQRKEAEQAREREQWALERATMEQGLKLLSDQLANAQGQVAQQHGELERVNDENRILKQAVRKQHHNMEKQQVEQAQKHRAELEALVNVGGERIRRLEHDNFILRAHFEQMATPHTDVRPPQWGT